MNPFEASVVASVNRAAEHQTIVVSAAIVDRAEKRLFMQRRGNDAGSYQWHWVTPGGKKNPSRMDYQELQRELFEEHGVWFISASDLRLIYEYEIESSRTGKPTVVSCYAIDSTKIIGEYKAGPGVAGFDWVNANELESLMLGPADAANRGKLLDLIR